MWETGVGYTGPCVVGAFPKHLDAVVRLQLWFWSLFWRRLRMLRNQICRRRFPKAPRRCGPPAIVVLVTLLATPQDASTNLQDLEVSFHRLTQTKDSNRIEQVGWKTRVIEHSTRFCKIAGKFPNNVFTTKFR